MGQDWLEFQQHSKRRKESTMKKAHGISIYEDLAEMVDSGHSCLVVWDVQNGLVDRIFNKEDFIGNLKTFIEGLRGKMPIVYPIVA
jgi:hypothetical protein